MTYSDGSIPDLPTDGNPGVSVKVQQGNLPAVRHYPTPHRYRDATPGALPRYPPSTLGTTGKLIKTTDGIFLVAKMK